MVHTVWQAIYTECRGVGRRGDRSGKKEMRVAGCAGGGWDGGKMSGGDKYIGNEKIN